MDVVEQNKIKHLYNRAGFGIGLEKLYRGMSKELDNHVSDLFKSSKNYTQLNVINEFDFVYPGNKRLQKEEKQAVIKDSEEKMRSLNLQWMDKIIFEDSQLREKMTLFWHDHFSTQNRIPYFAQTQNNIFRKHALGSFRALLFDLFKDPSMVQFLNNKQIRKKHPNELFARDLLEQYTVGPENLKMQDIKSVARSFTGWMLDDKGRAVFLDKEKDKEEKILFNIKGNFSVDEILIILLKKQEVANFITTKIYRYFVNDVVDKEVVNTLAEKFYKSDYDIGKLLKEIFTSTWFYSKENIGAKIKSPIELIVSLNRSFPITLTDKKPFIYLQKLLGQVLFYPPSSEGWPKNIAWIDPASIIVRSKVPDYLLDAAPLTMNVKEDGDVETEFLSEREFDNIASQVNWESFSNLFNDKNNQEIFDHLANYLLQVSLLHRQKEIILRHSQKGSKMEFVKNISLAITALPEFQMC